MKEACRERSSRESTTTTKVGKCAATRQKLINQRNGDKRVEEVSRGALARALNPGQIDERIPRI
jgi:hypothetical protein